MRNLVWFRNDLRVYDNPALDAACNPNNEVVATTSLLGLHAASKAGLS